MYKNIYVIGVFDLFHRGHLELLRKAKELGENLIVAVNSDAKVGSYKRKPVVPEYDRLEIVKACRYVNEAFIIDGYAQQEYIEKYNIDAIIHGDDWGRERYLHQICVTEAYLKERKTELILLPYTSGVSTSQILNRIRALEREEVLKQIVELQKTEENFNAVK
ncbi:MAG TPA: adenylyltransferase/cytidyltransferase family protein [Chitinophagaceae bacterium]|nr:adenylyltransferase/cytidyltransferase family protein [Chitinophagaceae bacterium]